MFTDLCNHHKQFLEHFHHTKKKLYPLAVTTSIFSNPLALRQTLIYFLFLQIFLFCTFHVNGIIQNMVLMIGFFHLASCFLHSSMLQRILVLHFLLLLNIFHSMNIPHFICPFSYVEHLGCFYFLGIMNTITMNIFVQVCVWTLVFIFLTYVLRSGITESYGNFMFNILRNYQTVFLSECTILHYQEQCLRVPISLHFQYSCYFLYYSHSIYYKGKKWLFSVMQTILYYMLNKISSFKNVCKIRLRHKNEVK